MSQIQVPNQIQNDLMFKFLNEMNSQINTSIDLYNKGVSSAKEFAEKMIEFGKSFSKYTLSLSKAQLKKYSALKQYVNVINPIKDGKIASRSQTNIKDLESNAIKAINSTNQFKKLENHKTSENSMEL